MVDKETQEFIDNLDEQKVLEMIEAEKNVASSTANKRRVEKRLLDDLGLFDIDLDEFDISRESEDRVLYLKYVNVDSDVQEEFSEETKRRTRERLRELGLEPDRE